MQKRQKGRKFSRRKGVRNALFHAIIRALAQKEKIQTTEAKAKEIAPLMERLITRAKHNTLHSRRELLSYLDVKLVKKMVEEIAPRYRERQGGYTRITKIAPRKSDSARMAIVELIH